MSQLKSLVVGSLSAVEQRNLECLEQWANAYTLPGGSARRLVDDIYAEAPEVVSVLTGTHVARAGVSKRAWREAEIAMESLYLSRRIIFSAVHPRADTIAIEAAIDQVLRDGTRRGWPFAVFLSFDPSGRIVRDHTYMLPPPHQDQFERAAAAVQTAPEQGHGT